MVEQDVILSKINIVKNCLSAIEKAQLKVKDHDFQLNIFELNLQRAVQACIDIANVVIAKEGLGLPNSYRVSFEILEKHQVINEEIAQTMKAMVGFRNISVHDYQVVRPEIVNSIVQHKLNDFEKFYAAIVHHMKSW